MNLMKLSQKGFTHIIAPVLVVVGIGAVGTLVLLKSHAATCKDYTWRQGQSGTCVVDIQQIINHEIAKQVNLTVDGSFGPATTSAVKTYQNDYHFVADGVVGPITWTGLCKPDPVNASTSTYQHAAGCF